MRPGGGFAVEVAGCSGHGGYEGLSGLIATFLISLFVLSHFASEIWPRDLYGMM